MESEVLTWGSLFFVVTLISIFCGAVWKVAAIRKQDHVDIDRKIEVAKQSIQNGVDRLERKVDDNHDQLHARVNHSAQDVTRLKYKVGTISGFLRGKFNADTD